MQGSGSPAEELWRREASNKKNKRITGAGLWESCRGVLGARSLQQKPSHKKYLKTSCAGNTQEHNSMRDRHC